MESLECPRREMGCIARDNGTTDTAAEHTCPLEA